jgi:hypothetical protein
MIREATFYAVACDYPGCSYDTSDIGEYASWMDEGQAVDEWNDADNLTVHLPDGTTRHYCREHTMWNPDDESDDPVILPLPEGIEGEFILAERRIRMRIDIATTRALADHMKRCSDWHYRDKVKFDALEARLVRDTYVRAVARAFDVPPELLAPPDGHVPAWQRWDSSARQDAV